MNFPEKQRPTSSVTIAMLISETVYKLIVLIERMLRWNMKFVVRPCLLQIRCLLW